MKLLEIHASVGINAREVLEQLYKTIEAAWNITWNMPHGAKTPNKTAAVEDAVRWMQVIQADKRARGYYDNHILDFIDYLKNEKPKLVDEPSYKFEQMGFHIPKALQTSSVREKRLGHLWVMYRVIEELYWLINETPKHADQPKFMHQMIAASLKGLGLKTNEAN